MKKLTLVHPAMGRRPGEHYIRAWQMETLPMAALAGLTPKDVAVTFFDDRMEEIDFDKPTDAVAISVETYTAKRAYRIAEEYRKRGAVVMMGGFHATLATEEVAGHADVTVVGEAEGIWDEVMDDFRHGTMKSIYHGSANAPLDRIRVDRTLFEGKRYLPVTLVETGRGCKYACEFCAIGSFFKSTRRQRPIESVLHEVSSLKDKGRLFFFVDDNFAAEPAWAEALMRALSGSGIRWVSQMSLPAAMDEKFLSLMKSSGCVGVLVGIESLNDENLSAMNKSFNASVRTEALDNLRKYGIGVYATFVFGYDGDRRETFHEAVDYALSRKFFIAAFNHLTPFPGTPIYERLEREGRLLFDRWWLDDGYRYNDLPFLPRHLSPQEVTDLCVESRRRYYTWKNIFLRSFEYANVNSFFKLRNYLPVNLMHRWDVSVRNGYPVGDV